MKKQILSLIAVALCALNAADTVVKLPEPNKKGGMPLMEALANRKSSRAFNSKAAIQPDVLGDLLWATWGFNRPGLRTAPTAINLQELDVYVLKEDGCWLYDAEKHALVRTVAKDLRPATLGKLRQNFVLDAPVTLAIVADKAKATSLGNKDFSEIDSGYLSQNIYLYCASAGLATVVRASFPPTLAKEMGLKDTQQVTLVQCVGWPDKED
ncbi:MAG: SagB/ThcOx family dehydrogenase [Victivallales bacterium]|nr:SagB/ThcOx family dehydrogenase [Victivallales bacterium]